MELKEYDIHIEETEEDEDEDILGELEKRKYERTRNRKNAKR